MIDIHIYIYIKITLYLDPPRGVLARLPHTTYRLPLGTLEGPGINWFIEMFAITTEAPGPMDFAPQAPTAAPPVAEVAPVAQLQALGPGLHEFSTTQLG